EFHQWLSSKARASQHRKSRRDTGSDTPGSDNSGKDSRYSDSPSSISSRSSRTSRSSTSTMTTSTSSGGSGSSAVLSAVTGEAEIEPQAIDGDNVGESGDIHATTEDEDVVATEQQQEEMARRLEQRLMSAEKKRLEREGSKREQQVKSAQLRRQVRAAAQQRLEAWVAGVAQQREERAEKAQSNRAAILTAGQQKRAQHLARVSTRTAQRARQAQIEQERAAQLLKTLSDRIAAASSKRDARLLAERQRAAAQWEQARQVAAAVVEQRQRENRERRERLERKVAKARGRRAEMLRRKGGGRRSALYTQTLCRRVQWQLLSRRLLRCWRQFKGANKTTLELARAFCACQVSRARLSRLPFPRVAARIQSPASLSATDALLQRLHARLLVSSAVASASAAASPAPSPASTPSSSPAASPQKQPSSASQTAGAAGVRDIDHLLAQVAPPPSKPKPSSSAAAGASSAVASTTGGLAAGGGEGARKGRYPPRVFLCAYMIVLHPDAVLSCLTGEREAALRVAAAALVSAFEGLVRFLLRRPTPAAAGPAASSVASTVSATPAALDASPSAAVPAVSGGAPAVAAAAAGTASAAGDGKAAAAKPFSQHLAEFDAAWVDYLERFVAWKARDKERMEADMVAMACQMHASMLRRTAHLPDERISEDLQAIREQVAKDIPMLRSKLRGLAGEAGARMKAAMHRAFWDATLASLLALPPDTAAAARLVGELREELLGIAPRGWHDEVTANLALDEADLEKMLTQGTPDAFHSLQALLAYATDLTLRLGAPFRDDATRAALAQLNHELGTLVATGGARSLAEAVVKGLKFAFERLEELKADIAAARARLTPLATTAATLQAALAKRFDLPAYPTPAALTASSSPALCLSTIKEKLSRTFSWVASSLNQSIPSARTELQPYLATSASTSSSSAASSVAATLPSASALRTGQRALSSSGASMNGSGNGRIDWAAAACVVRVGLVEVVTSAEGAEGGTVAEALWLDVGKLRHAQNEFQCVVVVAIGLLLLRQLLAARAILPSPAVEAVVAATRTTLARLVSSPDASRPALASALADAVIAAANTKTAPAAGAPADGAAIASAASDRAGIESLASSLLLRALAPSDAIFLHVRASVAAALRALLLLRPVSQSQALLAAQAALRKAAAGDLLSGSEVGEGRGDGGEGVGVTKVVRLVEEMADVVLAVHEPLPSDIESGPPTIVLPANAALRPPPLPPRSATVGGRPPLPPASSDSAGLDGPSAAPSAAYTPRHSASYSPPTSGGTGYSARPAPSPRAILLQRSRSGVLIGARSFGGTQLPWEPPKRKPPQHTAEVGASDAVAQSLDYELEESEEARAADRLGLGEAIEYTAAKWVLVLLIGCMTGGAAFLINMVVENAMGVKLALTIELLNGGSPFLAVLVYSLMSALLVAASAALCVFVAPAAAGSGIPEVRAYLNGVDMPHVLSPLTLLVKWVAASASLCVLEERAYLNGVDMPHLLSPLTQLVKVGRESMAGHSESMAGHSESIAVSVCALGFSLGSTKCAGLPPTHPFLPPSHPFLPPSHPFLPPTHPFLPPSHPFLPPSHPFLPPTHPFLPPSHPFLPPTHPFLPPTHPFLPPTHPFLPPTHPFLPPSHPFLPPTHPFLPPSHPFLPPTHPFLPPTHPFLPPTHPFLPPSHPFLPQIPGSMGAEGVRLALSREGPLVHIGVTLSGTQRQTATALGNGISNPSPFQIVGSMVAEACGLALGTEGALVHMELTSWWKKKVVWKALFTNAVGAIALRALMAACQGGRCGLYSDGGFILFDAQ
ncbi:unnamed protein product, partial [Closterium sp. Yama58-4]